MLVSKEVKLERSTSVIKELADEELVAPCQWCNAV
jgi:hypothetical protein